MNYELNNCGKWSKDTSSGVLCCLEKQSTLYQGIGCITFFSFKFSCYFLLAQKVTKKGRRNDNSPFLQGFSIKLLNYCGELQWNLVLCSSDMIYKANAAWINE